MKCTSFCSTGSPFRNTFYFGEVLLKTMVFDFYDKIVVHLTYAITFIKRALFERYTPQKHNAKKPINTLRVFIRIF